MKTSLRTLGSNTAYCLAQLPIVIASFTVIVTALSVGAGLAITIVGLPLVALTAYLARGFAHGERTMLRSLVGQRALTPSYKPAGEGWLRRWTTPLTDPQSWLDIGFAVLRFPLGIISWTLVVTWWAGALGGLTYPIYGWAIPRGPEHSDLPEILGLGDNYFVASVFYLIIGALFAITLRWVVLAATWLHAGPAVMMLCSRAELQQELADSQEGRAASRQAQSGALRRLERDIHDGPQQQIVRLSMDLGRARQQLRTNPDGAQAILDEAIARSTDTLDELRALSRGIAPPILVDRGLEAAIAEIATRAPVPVHLDYRVRQELPEHIETTAYFVVSEALTNLAKHSQATLASVSLGMETDPSGDELRVSITDDGKGGAHMGKGSGLAGLADRVRAVDGSFEVFSPLGGPTTIEARMPCA